MSLAVKIVFAVMLYAFIATLLHPLATYVVKEVAYSGEHSYYGAWWAGFWPFSLALAAVVGVVAGPILLGLFITKQGPFKPEVVKAEKIASAKTDPKLENIRSALMVAEECCPHPEEDHVTYHTSGGVYQYTACASCSCMK